MCTTLISAIHAASILKSQLLTSELMSFAIIAHVHTHTHTHMQKVSEAKYHGRILGIIFHEMDSGPYANMMLLTVAYSGSLGISKATAVSAWGQRRPDPKHL